MKSDIKFKRAHYDSTGLKKRSGCRKSKKTSIRRSLLRFEKTADGR